MATKYASGSTWNTNSSWGTASGLTDSTVPTSSDDSIFDGNSVNMAIDANASCKSISTSSFANTLTQNTTRTLTVANTFAWTSGTFAGGDSTITFTGAFSINGGTVTFGTQDLLVYANWTYTSGTLTAGSSTVIIKEGAKTISGSHTLNNLKFKTDSGGGGTNQFDIATGTIITTNGTLTFDEATGGYYYINYSGTTGEIYAKGDVTSITATGWAPINTCMITLNGTGTQTLTGSTTIDKSYFTGITIDKASGTLNLANYIHVRGAWIYTQGTLSPGTSTVCFEGTGGAALNGTHTLANINFRANAGPCYHAFSSGTVLTATGDVTSSGTQYQYLTGGTVVCQGNYSQTNSNGTAYIGSTAFKFTGTNSQTVSITGNTGSFFSDGTITIDKASGTVTLLTAASANSTGQDLTVTSGTLVLAGYNLTVKDVLTVSSGATFQLNGGETVSYGTLTLSSGSIVKYVDPSTARTLKNWTYSNLTIAGGASVVFSLGEAHTSIATLTLTTGIFYLAGYNMTATTFVNDATLRLQGVETVTVTQDTDSGLWEYVGRNIAETITIKDFGAGTDYYRLKINDTNGTKATFSLGAALTFTVSFSITSGIFTANSNTIIGGGLDIAAIGTFTAPATMSLGTLDITSGATFNHSNGKITITGDMSGEVGASLYDLEYTKTDLTLTISTGTMTVLRHLTFSSATSAAIYGTIYVGGNLTSTCPNATGTSSISLNGTGTQTITATDLPNGTLVINKASGSAILGANLNLNGTGQDLTVTAGTLDLAGYDLTVADVFTVSSGAILKAKGNETITAATRTLASGSTVTYYDGAVTAVCNKINNIPSGVTVRLGASKTHNFTSSATYTFDGTWESDGAKGATASLLRPTVDDEAWLLDFGGTSNLVDKVSVKDSNASSGNQVSAVGSENVEGNTNWDFGGAASILPAWTTVLNNMRRR